MFPTYFNPNNFLLIYIARWLEDMNFMFEWQEQYLTRSFRSLVRYCSCHSNIKFISSSQRVMFFLLCGDLVQSLNSPFFPPHKGAEPGRAKEESRITCMRMLRTPPFFPPNRGKNHIWKYFPDLACGAIF